MILVFGGTTEGRQAVRTLEEAGNPYYYSTRSDGQQVDLLNGVRLEGALDVPKMLTLCQEYGIRLIVDAAHPFAEELHRNLLILAAQIQVPIIRYDRIYPPRTADIIWCKDYADAISRMESDGISRLLALTGVNTISKLKPFWEVHQSTCWFRILNRQASHHIAQASRFPIEQLVYYGSLQAGAGTGMDEETDSLIRQFHPDAIITKESGLSGGFDEKVATARAAGVRIYAIERPAYPPHVHGTASVTIATVNGPHGLRREVERLLPTFYPLHSGLTTGTCATAAAVAAATRLIRGEMPPEVPVVLPNGESILVTVTYGDGYATVKKEAGDDPDVTDGIEIRASVEFMAGQQGDIMILGGEGVGTFTLPGFDFPPGSPAINKAPRKMICHNLAPFHAALKVTITVPEGKEKARHTFNPRLGIEGGISIIGVSGIVKPFSEEAFIESIRKCMEVGKAAFAEIPNPEEHQIIINSGAKSERYLKALFPTLPRQVFVEYGNYIGETLRIANELGIPCVTLGVMLGKAVKLAAGHLDTHSRKAVMDKVFIGQMLTEAGLDISISDITLARELWDRIPQEKTQHFCNTVIRHCADHCRPLLPKGTLTILLVSDNGTIYQQATQS